MNISMHKKKKRKRHSLVSVHVQAYTIRIIIIIFRRSVLANKCDKIHENLDQVQLYVFYKWGPWSYYIFFSYGLFFFTKGKQLHLEQVVQTLI